MKLGCTHLTRYAFLLFCFLAVGCAGSTATGDEPNKRNVLLICVDDLRPELKCFGVEHIWSPNIDALAQRGRAFHSTLCPSTDLRGVAVRAVNRPLRWSE